MVLLEEEIGKVTVLWPLGIGEVAEETIFQFTDEEGVAAFRQVIEQASAQKEEIDGMMPDYDLWVEYRERESGKSLRDDPTNDYWNTI